MGALVLTKARYDVGQDFQSFSTQIIQMNLWNGLQVGTRGVWFGKWNCHSNLVCSFKYDHVLGGFFFKYSE